MDWTDGKARRLDLGVLGGVGCFGTILAADDVRLPRCLYLGSCVSIMQRNTRCLFHAILYLVPFAYFPFYYLLIATKQGEDSAELNYTVNTPLGSYIRTSMASSSQSRGLTSHRDIQQDHLCAEYDVQMMNLAI